MKNSRKQNFIEITKTEFQPYTSKLISDNEAIEIQKNFFGFIELLLEWDENEKKKSCKICNTKKAVKEKLNG